MLKITYISAHESASGGRNCDKGMALDVVHNPPNTPLHRQPCITVAHLCVG